MMTVDAPYSRFLMVVWELTLQCNLACGHCGSRAGRARPRELNTTEALDLVRQLSELQVREVALIGGEAYLRPDWDVIARAITDHGIYCSMVSGGRGLNADVARRARRAGIVNVAISVDGLEVTHDLQRGIVGSYHAALNALGHLAAAGVKTTVNTQINRLSLPELEPLLEVLLREPIWAWGVQLTVAMGRAVEQADWLLQPYELLDLFPRLVALKQRCQQAGVHFSPGNNIGYFGPYEHLLRGNNAGSGHWTGCQAGERGLGIEADGTLKGCPSLPTLPYAGGSVRDQPLRELLKAPPLRVIQDRSSSDLWGFCRGCYYAEVCRAGCTWTSHVLFGRPGNNPYCHYRALQFQQQGLRERLVRSAEAPGLPFDHGQFKLVVEPLSREESTHATHK
jgi:radical SAM protein with 4Fe4S-binding SPASM domain